MSGNWVVQMPENKAINQTLSEVEFALQRSAMTAMPRHLTIVMGNGCNIDCPHCYQLKNGDNLFRDSDIAQTLRREFQSFYPFLTTLRIQGGEVFALRGFRELIEDVRATVDRPLISISTNGTMITEEWARLIVDTPFQHITISLDAGTKDTFEKVRRGAKFDEVKNNILRIQELKRARNTGLPTLDSFFVIMKSNYREIPNFLDLADELGIWTVSFQTMLIDSRNLQREPHLVDEVVRERSDVVALHAILKDSLRTRKNLVIRFSGLTDLFNAHDLDSEFLAEGAASLAPGSERGEQPKDIETHRYPTYISPPMPELPSGVTSCRSKTQLCSNPWYTMFVTENGDVSLCFLSEPVGNLFETPLVEIWNGPMAIAKRSRMIAGRYTESGCSSLWCKWRDGLVSDVAAPDDWRELLGLSRALAARLTRPVSNADPIMPDTKLGMVRRALSEKSQRIKELEATLPMMHRELQLLHDNGQRHIDFLEAKIEALEKRQS